MTPPLYTIHVAVHNRLELTQKCLTAIHKHSHDYELIVTDNASSDGTETFLDGCRSLFKSNYTVVRNTENLGFKDPCNHALTLARGEYLVLLNNDVEVCHGWLEALRQPFTTTPDMGITGITNTCTTISEKLVGTRGSRLDYIEGSCLMVPVALARKHGLFSDYLSFAYWEDTDLSLRLRERGYRIATVSLPIHHNKRGSTSSLVPGIQEHLARNTEEMKKRWGFYFKRKAVGRRILVRRLGAHGDVLLATPALRALRLKYPLATIDVVTKCPSMLAGLDWLRLAAQKRSWYDEFYDLDLAYEKRPEVHVVKAFGDALGVEVPRNWRLEMAASEMDMAWAERVCRGLKVAVVHPGPTCWPGKNWPVERFKTLVVLLRLKGYFTICVGGVDAPQIGADLHLGGATTPQQLYALCKVASLFVGIDSMPQHVASAADCPSVVLYGPTNPRALVRPTPRIIAVQADVAQVPCVGSHGRRTVPVTRGDPCEGECMKAISVEMVGKAVERVERLVAA